MNTKEYIIEKENDEKLRILWYPAKKEYAPLLVEVHGGGFIGGCPEDDQVLCETLCEQCDVNVASIDYRYAPERIYPTATYDGYELLEYLYNHKEIDFDREHIFLIGHSAGANVVTGMCQLAVGKILIQAQILDYPFLDCYINPKKRMKVRYAIPPFVCKKFNDAYYPNVETRKDALASPRYIDEAIAKNMPKTLVITCGRDNLREDGMDYAKALENAGVSVKEIDYPDAVYGFIEIVPGDGIQSNWWLPKKLRMKQVELYQEALKEIVEFVREK